MPIEQSASTPQCKLPDNYCFGLSSWPDRQPRISGRLCSAYEVCTERSAGISASSSTDSLLFALDCSNSATCIGTSRIKDSIWIQDILIALFLESWHLAKLSNLPSPDACLPRPRSSGLHDCVTRSLPTEVLIFLSCFPSDYCLLLLLCHASSLESLVPQEAHPRR